MKVQLYVLIDPFTLKIRYIGRTSNSLQKRLIGHISKSKRKQNHKDYWIQSLIRQGYKPIIKQHSIIEGWVHSYKCEQLLINKALNHGFKLLNLKDRGEGGVNNIVTDEQKQKISYTLKEGYKSGKIKPSRVTKIYTFDLNGLFLKEYNSCSDCISDIGIPRSSLEKVLSKKVKRWTTFQITYGNNPGIYSKVKTILKTLEKEVFILDNVTKETLHFKSFKVAATHLKVSSPTIRRYIKSKKLYKNYYIAECPFKTR